MAMVESGGRGMGAEEEKPSARQIGREFVRQYYTMLATQSRHVHRFYSHDSTYIHGETGEAVKGQTAIQREIAALDISTCSAKILKVDSAETLGNGVVIQVIGLLNLNGQGYQRFLQTFVLAPQSQKNYYVFNDIFRYELALDAPEDNARPLSNGTLHPPPPAQQPKAESPASDEPRASPPESEQAIWAEADDLPAQDPKETRPTPLIPANTPLLGAPPSGKEWSSSGSGGGRTVGVGGPGLGEREGREGQPVQAPPAKEEPVAVVGSAAQPPSDPSPAPQPQPPAPVEKHPPVPAPAPAPAPLPDNAPKTWANITKKNTGAPVSAPVVAAAPVVPVVAPPPAAEETEADPVDQKAKTADNPIGYVPCEVFVGSVPADMKEEGLADFFNGLLGVTGKVMTVRIRKPQQGGPGGNQIAFVTLASQEAVETILKDQKTPSERLNFPVRHGGQETELSITRVREQNKTGGGPGGRGGAAMRGAPRGMPPRGGYSGPGSFSRVGNPAAAAAANPNRRFTPNGNPRAQ